MKRSLLLLLLLLFVPAFAAEPPAKPDIAFPDIVTPPAPTPPAPPAAVTTLASEEYYVITSATSWLILDSPQGLVNVTTEAGPVRLRGKFAGGGGKVETRTYSQKQVVIVEAVQTGRVELLCVPSGATTTKDVVRRLIDVNVGPRPPPQPPGPEPPGPKPPGPTPGPAPIPAEGFRVLMIYESSTLRDLPRTQEAVLRSAVISSTPLGAYLASHCVKGPDGKTPEVRVWDKDVPTGAESKVWQDAMSRPRASVPWIIISTGRTGYEGPLPVSADATLTLLKQYGGP